MGGPTLYSMAAEYREAGEVLLDLDVDEQTLEDTLAGLYGPLEDKALSAWKFACHLDAIADAQKAAAKRMAERAKATDARADRLRTYIMACMATAGTKVVADDEVTLKMHDNPERVEVLDEAALLADDEFYTEKTVRSVNKTAVKEALKAGDAVPAARLVRSRRLKESLSAGVLGRNKSVEMTE